MQRHRQTRELQNGQTETKTDKTRKDRDTQNDET